MPTALSFLAFWTRKISTLSLHKACLYVGRKTAIATAVCSLSCVGGHAFTQVLIDPKAQAGIEEAFIAATTAQYNAKVVANPLASHTYSLTIFGPNPNFDPPPSYADVVKFSYPYGWASGMDQERRNDLGILSNAGVACSTDTTCSDTITGAINQIYQQNFSTPTVVPGGF